MPWNKTRSALFAAALAAGGMLAFALPADAGAYAVIVNSENGFSGGAGDAKAQVKRLFLKEQKSWPGGGGAVPFGRDAGSAVQSAFEANVLGMSGSVLDTHWLRLKQTSGETPPRGVGSASILIRQVSKTKGAFGFVSSGEKASLPPEVKILFEFD